jgi:hypothetical protein
MAGKATVWLSNVGNVRTDRESGEWRNQGRQNILPVNRSPLPGLWE